MVQVLSQIDKKNKMASPKETQIEATHERLAQ